jgi:uncharacterized protein with ParB-like and HNH nuclease domain
MQLPEPQTKAFPSLVGAIEQGQIKIPQFQRDFVWTIIEVSYSFSMGVFRLP